jgi:hypothetical protein
MSNSILLSTPIQNVMGEKLYAMLCKEVVTIHCFDNDNALDTFSLLEWDMILDDGIQRYNSERPANRHITINW